MSGFVITNAMNSRGLCLNDGLGLSKRAHVKLANIFTEISITGKVYCWVETTNYALTHLYVFCNMQFNGIFTFKGRGGTPIPRSVRNNPSGHGFRQWYGKASYNHVHITDIMNSVPPNKRPTQYLYTNMWSILLCHTFNRNNTLYLMITFV